MNRISCIILAGGKAERMGGKDKGLQDYRNQPLIEHVIARISPQVDDIIISANRNLAEYNQLGFPVVRDHNDDYGGPLAGIQSAFPHCKHSWVLVIPCDMPELPGDLVGKLQRHTDKSRVIAVRSNNKQQLVFLMHISLITSINDFLANGQHTVMRWLDSVDAYTLDIDNENYFHNINTFEQLNT